MKAMFEFSEFNGDISKWDVSNVENMMGMFSESRFNSRISSWNVSKVKDLDWMFEKSEFKGDLRPWNLTETQMAEAFQETLPNYLATRQSIEESEKLHAIFGRAPSRTKKSL
jgi:surface protein